MQIWLQYPLQSAFVSQARQTHGLEISSKDAGGMGPSSIISCVHAGREGLGDAAGALGRWSQELSSSPQQIPCDSGHHSAMSNQAI